MRERIRHFYMVYILQPFWWFCISCIPWFFAIAYVNVHEADHKAQGAMMDQQHLAELVKKVNEMRDKEAGGEGSV